MATPIPVAKPVSSGTAGIVGFLLLHTLLGGEYYLLTTRNALHHPDPLVAAQAAQAKSAKALK